MNGHGTFTFASGAKYEGIVRPDGTFTNGIFTSEKGDIYTGPFQGRRPHGKGYLITKNGDSYEGGRLNFRCFLHLDFVLGRKHGKGKLTLHTGEVFFGEFYEGKYVPPADWKVSRTSSSEKGMVTNEEMEKLKVPKSMR